MGKSKSEQGRLQVSKYRLKQIAKNGRYAASCRTPLTSCPFENGTLEGLAWVKGWWQFENERQNARGAHLTSGALERLDAFRERDLSADIENAVYAGVVK